MQEVAVMASWKLTAGTLFMPVALMSKSASGYALAAFEDSDRAREWDFWTVMISHCEPAMSVGHSPPASSLGQLVCEEK
jgi:hypothetical protein